MKIEVSTTNLKFLEAFSSPTRIRIIEMLNEKPMNVKDMATALNISSAIVTRHVQHLESVGILKSDSINGIRGLQKLCSLNLEQVTLSFKTKNKPNFAYSHAIPIGQYHAWRVNPTCGLASKSSIIGIMDDPRYFADPERSMASLLWFGSGWIEYRIPNYLLKNQKAKSLAISLEICSEAPGYNEDWPSDISFYCNDLLIGVWTSPGDFGKLRGVFTPPWWNHGTQHGLLKTIRVNEEGAFIDGLKASDTQIADLNISYGQEIRFKVANPENSINAGGVSIFGKNFGNYDQDIEAIVEYGML